jgi:hypothetical protein
MTGQLSLFKGPRQRGTKLPPPKEFASHCFIADLLRRWCSKEWRYTHLPMGEKRDKGTAARLKRMGVTPDWPDFLFVGPDGCCFWLELKRKGSGRLSDGQHDMAMHLVACGHAYLCTDSVDEAVAQLKALGILRSTVNVQ